MGGPKALGVTVPKERVGEPSLDQELSRKGEPPAPEEPSPQCAAGTASCSPLTFSGMVASLTELGGSGRLLHLAPANGFPPLSYTPLIQRLSRRYRVVNLPPRALWPGVGEPPQTPGSWAAMGDDLLAGLEHYELREVIGVGHSSGGVATVLAALREPSRFQAVCLLDPTIMPPEVMTRWREEKRPGWKPPHAHPLAPKARKRRAHFASHREAFGYWRKKRLFADWSDAALEHYVKAMLRPANGRGFVLTWAPAWEAYYYESVHTETWSDLERLDPQLPLLVVGGETSDTLLPASRALLSQRVPWAEIQVIAGHGHLFPHTAPEETARMILEWAERVRSP